MAVPVLLSVRLVVLVVVGNEVVERKPVMGRDEVDGGPGSAAALVEQVAGCREARRQLRQLAFVAFPEGPDRVAIAVVPLGPSGGEASDLISARTAIPGLGDELDLAEERILPAGVEKASILVKAMRLPRQDRCKIEAEAVDMHLLRPITQAVRDQL